MKKLLLSLLFIGCKLVFAQNNWESFERYEIIRDYIQQESTFVKMLRVYDKEASPENLQVSEVTYPTGLPHIVDQEYLKRYLDIDLQINTPEYQKIYRFHRDSLYAIQNNLGSEYKLFSKSKVLRKLITSEDASACMFFRKPYKDIVRCEVPFRSKGYYSHDWGRWNEEKQQFENYYGEIIVYNFIFGKNNKILFVSVSIWET